MSTSSNSRNVLCFGEVLWDCLPKGLFLGGAPFNVAYHLQQLGLEATMCSAVGADFLGEEIRRRMRSLGLDDVRVRTHPTLPTGVVQVELNDAGNARYEIVQPVAWDDIGVPDKISLSEIAPGALVYGSLALRSASNRHLLAHLLRETTVPVLMDVNLRPPFDPLDRVREWAAKATVVKLNEEELERLTGLSQTALADQMEALSRDLGGPMICVTRGAEGAALWAEGSFYEAAAPKVEVRDTVGAGDAFMARLTSGWVNGEAGDDPQKTLAEACELGAMVAGSEGAQPIYPH